MGVHTFCGHHNTAGMMVVGSIETTGGDGTRGSDEKNSVLSRKYVKALCQTISHTNLKIKTPNIQIEHFLTSCSRLRTKRLSRVTAAPERCVRHLDLETPSGVCRFPTRLPSWTRSGLRPAAFG